MKQKNNEDNIINYSISNKKNEEDITKLGRALSVPERIKILRTLQEHPYNIIDLSSRLDIPLSSVSFHIKVLEEAKLIRIEYKPAPKGHMKLCSINTIFSTISYTKEPEQDDEDIIIEMPVGCYSICNVKNAYMADENNFIFRENSSSYMLFTPNRINAQLFGFQSGHVVYNFPNLFITNHNHRRLSFSLECCSEAPYYCNNWPSDITIWINEIEIGTFCSPGDFGGKRGLYTPAYWQSNSTQYGILKKFSIDDDGCYIDDVLDNKNHTLKDLKLNEAKTIDLKIGIKDNAKHIGGINIFGKEFGNYPQNIVMALSKNS